MMIYEHLEGVDTSMDGIIVWGSTKAEHDKRLKNVLEATRKTNLKLNKEKYQLTLKELTFVEGTLSSEGIKPDPRKVSATENMPRPQYTKDVQRVKYRRLEEEEEGELAVLLQAGPGEGGEQTLAPRKQGKRLETLRRDRSD
eukprot:superscaffoldBa00001957_g12651